MGKWKAVRLNLFKEKIKTQLFDLETDIQEQNDVASDHPDVVKKMEDIMDREHHTPEVSRFLIPAIEKN